MYMKALRIFYFLHFARQLGQVLLELLKGLLYRKYVYYNEDTKLFSLFVSVYMGSMNTV